MNTLVGKPVSQLVLAVFLAAMALGVSSVWSQQTPDPCTSKNTNPPLGTCPQRNNPVGAGWKCFGFPQPCGDPTAVTNWEASLLQRIKITATISGTLPNFTRLPQCTLSCCTGCPDPSTIPDECSDPICSNLDPETTVTISFTASGSVTQGGSASLGAGVKSQGDATANVQLATSGQQAGELSGSIARTITIGGRREKFPHPKKCTPTARRVGIKARVVPCNLSVEATIKVCQGWVNKGKIPPCWPCYYYAEVPENTLTNTYIDATTYCQWDRWSEHGCP